MRTKRASFPSDDMIVLGALMEGGLWRQAEDIASTLRRLGFVVSPQKMVGQLKRLEREDAAMFESKVIPWARLKEYRVTQYGRTQLRNHYRNAPA